MEQHTSRLEVVRDTSEQHLRAHVTALELALHQHLLAALAALENAEKASFHDMTAGMSVLPVHGEEGKRGGRVAVAAAAAGGGGGRDLFWIV